MRALNAISDWSLSPPRLSDYDVVASSQQKANLAQKAYSLCNPASVAWARKWDFVFFELRIPRHELLGELAREPQRSQIHRFSLLPQWAWAIVRPKFYLDHCLIIARSECLQWLPEGNTTLSAAPVKDPLADTKNLTKVCDDGHMFVWLTDWQIAEDHLFIRVGDTVDWTVYPADRDWVSRLFGHRLVIDWQFDSYGDAVDQPSRRVSGKVAELFSVRCRQTRAREGLVPVTGEATLQPVADTSGSWVRDTAHDESPANTGQGQTVNTFSQMSAFDDVEADYLYGYVLSLADYDEENSAVVTPRQ